MKCPGCGADNHDEAMSCGLCQMVLKRKAAGAVATAEPGMPGFGSLGGPDGVKALLLECLTLGMGGRMPLAEAKMGLLYAQVDRDFCADLLRESFKAWKATTKKASTAQAAAFVVVEVVAIKISQGKMAEAVGPAMQLVAAMANEVTAETCRVQLLLLGLKGYVTAAGQGAAGAAPAGAAPKAAPAPAHHDVADITVQETLAQAMELAAKKDIDGARACLAKMLKTASPAMRAELITATGNVWISKAGLSVPEEMKAAAALSAAAEAAAKGDFKAAHLAMRPVAALARGRSDDQALRIGLVILGLQGAEG